MEFKTEEELIEMGKCQLIRLVLDLQNEIKYIFSKKLKKMLDKK